VRFFVILSFLALTVFFGADSRSAGAAEPAAAGSDYFGNLEKETFSLINAYRKDHDLPPLTWDSVVAAAARGHSRDMATGEVDFGHGGFEDRVSRLRSAMPGLSGAGENVLMTSNPDQVARTAVTLWLHSAHHLANIRGDFNYSGLGVWRDKDGAIYFTQIFVRINPAAQEAPEAAVPPVMTPFGMMTTSGTRPGP
jgi:uncharacterized protein YkwD